MRFPSADDTELLDLIDRYVDHEVGGGRRYMKLLHGNFLGMPERAAFLRELVDAAKRITDHELGVLLDSEWRSRITAAWLIGVSRREQFRARLGGLLLASELVNAGQGYCFALARFGTAADAEILAAYLDRYLRPGVRYNQDWAFGALRHIDADQAARFLGPWQQWAGPNYPSDEKERMGTLCALVQDAVRE
jgi:hypothetical protein